MNKYQAKKTEYNGTLYDSKGEAKLAQNIDLLIKAKEVRGVERQVKIPLYGINRTKICTIVVDFKLTMKDGSVEIWEYKGMETIAFKLKYKLFKDNYPDTKYILVKQSDL